MTQNIKYLKLSEQNRKSEHVYFPVAVLVFVKVRLKDS